MPNIWRAPWLIVQLPFLLLFGALTCRRLLATRMFDLVHAHWIIPQGIQLRLAAIAMRRAPCIVTSHGGDLWTLRGKLGRQLKIWTLRRCESITVVSKAMQPIAAGLAPNAAIDVIPMGTEMNVFYPPATPAPLLRLLFAGRLSEKKGVETAIRAIAMLRDLPNLHLTVAGDGPLRKSLEQLVHDLDVNDKITFAGWQDRNRLAELLRMHGVFVFPSVITRSGDQEGLGLTLAEAMATGCSVIASDLPAVRDLVIDEKTGYTFPPGDHVALAARIRAIQNDAATARQVATAARQHVERKFSMEHSAEQFCKLYNSLIENNTSA